MEPRRPDPDSQAHVTDEQLHTALAETRSVLKSHLRSGRTALRQLTALEQLLERRHDTAPGGTADV